jgi:hypothetical protein
MRLGNLAHRPGHRQERCREVRRHVAGYGLIAKQRHGGGDQFGNLMTLVSFLSIAALAAAINASFLVYVLSLSPGMQQAGGIALNVVSCLLCIVAIIFRRQEVQWSAALMQLVLASIGLVTTALLLV